MTVSRPTHATAAEGAPALPQLGFGPVRHTRLRPVHHAFAYAGYFLLLPMRALLDPAHPASRTLLARNRPAALSFFDADHGDGRGPEQGGALAWLDDMLHGQGVHDAGGEVWLQCYPRVFGYTFKPVSFWFCHRSVDDDGGSLRAIVVEVNNTFGERHCYLLDRPAYGASLQAIKVFHVSPFLAVEGSYHFRFMRAWHAGQQRSVARIDYHDAGGAVLQTSVSGVLEPVCAASLRKALWRHPAMTPDWHGKTVWLVGASSGIGRATASLLHARGANVIVSARSAAALEQFVAEHPGARAVPLDVTDSTAVRAATLPPVFPVCRPIEPPMSRRPVPKANSTAAEGEGTPVTMDIDRIIRIFESLTKQSMADLGAIYAPDARFSDPFNTVQGLDAVQQVFSHMFESLEHPRFVVAGKVVQDDQCFLLWEFRFRFRSFQRQVDQVVPGTSHLRFDRQGRITHHHDYWDAAHGIYEKIPLVGSLMRWLRARVNG